MNLLCIEISAEPGVIGLAQASTVLFEQYLDDRTKFGAVIDRLFATHPAELSDLFAVVIGNGPGSFTGLRVGLAFAKGLAMTRNIPLWPLPSQQVYAANIAVNTTVAVISPARRGHVHLALFSGPAGPECLSQQVISIEELAELIPVECVVTGPALPLLPSEIRAQFAAQCISDNALLLPKVAQMAELARKQWQHREAPNIHRLLPDYGLDFA